MGGRSEGGLGSDRKAAQGAGGRTQSFLSRPGTLSGFLRCARRPHVGYANACRANAGVDPPPHQFFAREGAGLFFAEPLCAALSETSAPGIHTRIADTCAPVGRAGRPKSAP